MVSMLILLLSILVLSIARAESTIYIDPQTGYNLPICFTGEIDCATLSYAINGINDSTTIVLANGVHSVNDTVYMSDVNNVTFISSSVNSNQSVGAVLHCNGSNSGLKFVKIANLSISGI